MTITLNLFSLMKDNSIRRIVTNNDVQKEISNFFLDLKKSFYMDQDEIMFDGRYKVDTGEIFAIPDFPIPDNIHQSISNPVTIDVLKLKQEKDNIKGLFCGVWNDNHKYIIFQTFDSRKVLSHKFTLIASKDSFTKLENPGIMIDSNINVLIKDNKMLFYSYHSASRLFDMSNYYKEATNEDLGKFAQSNILDFADNQWFIQNADSIVRKKVALLQKNAVLENVNMRDIQDTAKNLNIALEIKDNKIHIPADRKKLKEIVKFLDEDYFIAPLSKKKCMTNSKMYIQ